jgi:hypothetical protein
MSRRLPLQSLRDILPEGRAVAISNQHRLFGDLLCRFANAKDSDEAGLKYLEDLKRAFSLADIGPTLSAGEAASQHNGVFRTMRDFMSQFNTVEREIFHLKVKEKPLLDEVKEILPGSDELVFGRYDPLKKIIIFDRCTYNLLGFYEDGSPYGEHEIVGTRDFPVEDIEKNFDQLSWRGESPKRTEMIADLIHHIDELMEIGTAIEELRINISGPRYTEIGDCLKDYLQNIEPEHRYIVHRQNLLRTILDHIINNTVSTENTSLKILNGVVNRYNDIPKKIAQMTSNGDFEIASYPFTSKLLNAKPRSFRDYYSEPLAYCLVEFFSLSENKKYLKRCPVCRDFFITKHKSRELCYEPKDCKKVNKDKWQVNFMRKKRDKDSDEFDPRYV